jgi:nucleoside-diphosphate-sugar epimerase
MKIAIVGASGYLASNFVTKGLTFSTNSIDKFSYRRSDSNSIFFDVLDLDCIQNTFKLREYDLIINFAGRLSPIDKIGEDLNSLSSANLVSVLKSIGRPTTLMHLSSALESNSSEAESDYAMSKSLGTKNLLGEALNSNVGIIVVKVHNVIGRDQNHRKLVGTLIKHATLGLPITLNHPNRVRDFVWVDDFAKALWKIVDDFELLSEKQFHRSNEYLVARQLDWEIGTGIGTKISDLAFEIYERLGHSKDLVDYETFEKEIDPYEVCVAGTSNDKTIRCASNLRYILDTMLGEKL